MHSMLAIFILLALSSATISFIPRQVLITKFVKNIGPTNPASFIDSGHTRLKSWNILTAQQLNALETTDRDYYYNKAGINVSTGVESPLGSGILNGPSWTYIPTELQSTERLDWVVSDSYKPLRTSPLRSHNWITANGGNTLIFNSSGLFTGGQWAGLPYTAGGIISSEYVIMVPNVTMSRWKNNYELHYCTLDLEPAVAALNVYGQADTIVTKVCRGITTRGSSTIIATNIYTNTSSTTRDCRKTQAWTWSW